MLFSFYLHGLVVHMLKVLSLLLTGYMKQASILDMEKVYMSERSETQSTLFPFYSFLSECIWRKGEKVYCNYISKDFFFAFTPEDIVVVILFPMTYFSLKILSPKGERGKSVRMQLFPWIFFLQLLP